MTDQLPAQPHETLPPPRLSFLEENKIHPALFALGALFMVFVLYQVIAGTITVIVAGSKITPSSVMFHRFLTMSAQVLFIFLPTLLFARMLTPKWSDVFPLRIPRVPESIYALLGLVFLQQIFQIYLLFQEWIPLPKILEDLLGPIKQMVQEMFRVLVSSSSVGELAFVFLVVAVVPSIVEEMLFRGVIQSALEKVSTPLRAAILSGVIFGVFHFNPFALVPLMILGCYFGFLRMRSNSFLLPVAAHFINNAIAVVVVYLNMEDEMIVGLTKEAQPNLFAVFSQLFLVLVLFALSFVGYVRSTAHVRDSNR